MQARRLREGRALADRAHDMPLRARIAIFVFDLSATGVARNAFALAQALAATHDVELITCRSGVMHEPGIAVTTLGGAARIGPLALFRLGRQLRARVIETAPQIVISTGNRGHPLFLAALRGLTGLRRLYRFSNDIEHARGGRGKSIHTRVGDDVQMKALLGDADRIVLVSAHLLGDARLAKAHAAGQAVIIENGVDLDRIRARAASPCPHPFAAPGADPFVLAMGRLVPQKNLETLIDAVAHANRVRPLNLILLGGGSDAARAELITRARARGIEARVALAGVTDNPFAWLVRAAVFALPSWWEGASNSLLEALACGTPVVASATAGNAAAVLGDDRGGERYGLIADPGDAAAWSAALLHQTGPAKGRVLPGERAEAYRLDRTLAAWRTLVDAELVLNSRVR